MLIKSTIGKVKKCSFSWINSKGIQVYLNYWKNSSNNSSVIPFFYPSLGICQSELVAQMGPTLCNPMYHSPPGSSVHGTLQARILEWVATPSSRGSFHPRDWTQVSRTAGRFFIKGISKVFSHTLLTSVFLECMLRRILKQIMTQE